LIEDDLQVNRKTIQKIKGMIRELARKNHHVDWVKILDEIGKIDGGGGGEGGTGGRRGNVSLSIGAKAPVVALDNNVCEFTENQPPKVDVQVNFLVFLLLAYYLIFRIVTIISPGARFTKRYNTFYLKIIVNFL